MSVPTHNLYDFIHQVTKKKFFLLYFSPWGERDLKNIRHYQHSNEQFNGCNGIPIEHRFVTNAIPVEQINRLWATFVQPIIFCHDQEPLNYDLYLDDSDIIQYHRAWYQEVTGIALSPYTQNLNVRNTLPHSLQRKWVLLHSELNSSELDRYESTGQYTGAYWWSHAAISRDWYRFAEYDQSLMPGNHKKLFLTYCRDTTGSRTYRRTFLEIIDTTGLKDQCQVSSISTDEINSDSSAIYNAEDFNATAISVVLETVFDQRIHLTEKTLRPIACGHPFILAAGPGSLALLRKYGFQTFDGYINESYDNIQNCQERLEAICAEMKRISLLPADDRDQLLEKCQDIAKHNQTHFFSDEFFQQITDELNHNVVVAFDNHRGELDFAPWYRDHVWRCENKPEICASPAYKNISDCLLKICK
jgi:hypothetical protein